MRAEHPREWRAWADIAAVQHLAIELTRYERRQRARALSPARAFTEAIESGDVSALELFKFTFRIDGLNTRRPLGEMTARDCRYVSASYRRSGDRALLTSALFDAIAKRIKARKTVEQTMTEEQVCDLIASLGGGDALAA
jgi:hypothetical protein